MTPTAPDTHAAQDVAPGLPPAAEDPGQDARHAGPGGLDPAAPDRAAVAAARGTDHAVWAPHAENIWIEGDFNDWCGNGYRMERVGGSTSLVRLG